MRIALFLTAVALCPAPLARSRAEGGGTPSEQVIYKSGEKGYHTYRIPALALTTRGTLLAFCEGRKTSRSDHGDLDLMLRRSTDGGTTWSEQVIVYEEGGDAKITIGNPCPVVDETTGVVWLAFCRDNDRVFMTHSDDDGRSWSAPAEITRDVKRADWQWYATGPGHGIQITRGEHAGRLIFPCDHGVKTPPPGWDKGRRSHVFYSDDHGRTLQLGQPTDWGMNECEAAELTGGRLLLTMRNYLGKNQRAFSVSEDGGQSWSAPKHNEQVYCPTCQAALLRFSWTPNILLYSGPGGPGRTDLAIRASYDEGVTWPAARVLHEGPSAYSDLAVSPDGAICCLYEGGREQPYETITLAKFSLDWLQGP